jgi:hypothetical protein
MSLVRWSEIESEEDWLRYYFQVVHPWSVPPHVTRKEHQERFARWEEYVRSLDVVLFQNGRAEIMGEDVYPVDLRWEVHRGEPRITDLTIRGPLAWAPLPLDHYVAAWYLALPKAKPARINRRPAPGQPADLGFYENVLVEFEALIAAGERAPAKTLARKYGIKHNTAKAWIRRAKQYRRGD